MADTKSEPKTFSLVSYIVEGTFFRLSWAKGVQIRGQTVRKRFIRLDATFKG